MISVGDILALRNLSALEMFKRVPSLTDFGDGTDWVIDHVTPAMNARPELLDPLIEDWRAAAERIVAHKEHVAAAANAVSGSWTGEAASQFNRYVGALQNTLGDFQTEIGRVPQTLTRVRGTLATAKENCGLEIEDFGKSVFGTVVGGAAGLIAGGISVAAILPALAGIWVGAALYVYDVLKARDTELDQLTSELEALSERAEGIRTGKVPPLPPPKITSQGFSAVDAFIPRDPPPEIARYLDEHR